MKRASKTLPSAKTETARGREGLTLLGNGNNVRPQGYDPTLLERFENRHPGSDYMVTLRCPEFTTLCPVTGQPDYGELVIRYVPAKWLVESKSLKLYLVSFRNHGDFHEDVCNVVLNDLKKLLSPQYIEVRGRFRPRGGIAIRPLVVWTPKASRFAEMASNRLFAPDEGDCAIV